MKSAFSFCLALVAIVAALFCCMPATANDTAPAANPSISVLDAAVLPSVLPQGVLAITRETTHVVKTQSVRASTAGCQCGCGKEVCDCAACSVRSVASSNVSPKRERITVYYAPGPGNRKVAKGTAIQLKHSGSN